MRFDFLDWYNVEYPESNFESQKDRRQHQKISYSGWLAAMKTYGVKG